MGSLSARRAWIEILASWSAVLTELSLSARRAWIEIKIWYCGTSIGLVALRKESVDRNIILPALKFLLMLSLSARRAWIEI